MKCSYCGNDNQINGYCVGCGAKVEKQEIKKQDWKSEPFFYNGYICYQLRHMERDTVEVQFWLGMQLIERIELDYELFREKVPDGYDAMYFFWELFLLAHGEKEVIEWQEKNNKLSATFEIRYIPNPDKEYWRGLSMQDLANASKK